jgi:hypothetical protein
MSLNLSLILFVSKVIILFLLCNKLYRFFIISAVFFVIGLLVKEMLLYVITLLIQLDHDSIAHSLFMIH